MGLISIAIPELNTTIVANCSIYVRVSRAKAFIASDLERLRQSCHALQDGL